MEDGMNDLRAYWVLTVGILYLLPNNEYLQNNICSQQGWTNVDEYKNEYNIN